MLFSCLSTVPPLTLRWSADVLQLIAEVLDDNNLHIDAVRSPLLVQADGEVIGHNPVEIQMVAKAIHVIIPKLAE